MQAKSENLSVVTERRCNNLQDYANSIIRLGVIVRTTDRYLVLGRESEWYDLCHYDNSDEDGNVIPILY